MARVTGPSRAELDARGDEFAARVTRAIRTTLRSAASDARVPDDLARIQTIWRSVVKNSLAPHLRKTWDTAVTGIRVQLEKINEREQVALVAAVFDIPKVSNPLAEIFLADATNRLTAIGDVVWYTARGEMLTGMQLGEGVAELRERVKASANVSSKRAEVIARTEVNSAMNNGAYEQMKALDVTTIKEWIATNDSRTRESHEEVDGEEIAGDAKFMVGGFPMDHPHDLNAPPGETINCRCTLAWEIVDDEDDYEDDLLADASFHHPGRHNQKTHGHRYKTPGDKSSGLRDTKTSAKSQKISSEGQRVLDFIKDDAKKPLPASEANGHWNAFSNPNFTPGTDAKFQSVVANEKAADAMHPGYIQSEAAKEWLPLKKVNPASLVQTQKWLREIDLSQSVAPEEGDREAIVIYRAKDGTRYLTNGHHRVNLALAKGLDEIEVREATATVDVPSVTSPRRKETPRNALTAAGGFDEAVHPRDNKGKFAKKPGGGAGKSLKITHMLVHKNHGDAGTILTESGSGDKRVVWDGKEYRLQHKKDDGSWTTDKKVKKSKAYVEINAYDSDWREPSTGTSDSGETTPAETKSGGSLKITSSLLNGDHEVGDIIIENGAGNKRVVWDGDHYRLQVNSGEGWKTQRKVEPSSAVDAVNEFGADWHTPQHADIIEAKKADKAKPAPSVSEQLESMDGLTKVAPKKKGALFKNKYGDVYDVQPTQSESHARNELLASKLYAYSAIGVSHVSLVQTDPNKLPSPSGIGVKTDYKPGELGLADAMKTVPAVKSQVNQNFAFDAWLGNWDVVGLGYENLTVAKNGTVRRTNLGGSLLYRANGQPKGAAFGDTVNEIDSLRDPHLNPSAAKVFADVTDDDIRAGVAKIEKITPDDIDYLVSKAGFTGKEADLLSSKLQARRADLISKYGANAPKPAQSSGPAPSTQPTATNALSGTVKTYTAVQKAKVQSIFDKHKLKWHNKSNAIYDAAHEVSTTHPDLTMGDALDIMDQSLKKKEGNPFRTKVEKWLKTNAGKQHALAKGGSASLGGTAPKVSPAPLTPPTKLSAPSKTNENGFSQLNKPEASAIQAKMDKETPPPWTTEQRDALRTYTGGSYTTINKCARGTSPCDPSTKATLEHIKAAMKPSTRDILLYRATNPASFGIASGDELESMVGKTISDNGVISTSITKIGWSGKMKLEIEVPKGSNMAWVQPISLHPSENEMVLAPGTHYEVVSYQKESGYYGDSYTVRLRVIPGSDTLSQAKAKKELVTV